MRTPRFRMTAYEFSVQNAMNYINAFAVAAVAAVLLMSWIWICICLCITDTGRDLEHIHDIIHTISARTAWPVILSMGASA